MNRFFVSALIAPIGVVFLLAGLLRPPALHAQSAPASQGEMGPGRRAPVVAEPNPPALTPEQRRLQNESVGGTHLPGPSLPVEPGFTRRSPVLPPTGESPVAPKQPAPSGPESEQTGD